MKQRETLEDKAFRLWNKAGLPDFFNKRGPKNTPGWKLYLCHLEYTTHAPSWRRAANFMSDYHETGRHWTAWQKAIAKWPFWVWERLSDASKDDEQCELAAIDGTTMSRSNPSQHYLKRIDSEKRINRPIQQVVMINIKRRKFLSWKIRIRPRGEKCDVKYLFKHTIIKPETVIMDKGFDSEPLHAYLRANSVWSVAPARKNCRRGSFRKQLRDCFDYALYWQRVIIESMFSAIKRLFGVHIRARTWRAQRAEIYNRFIAYNIGAKKNYFLQSSSLDKVFKP